MGEGYQETWETTSQCHRGLLNGSKPLKKSSVAYFFAKFVVPILTSGGYVGLSLSVLLAQHNQVMAVDIVQVKVDMINNHKSPIQDDYIEKYLAEKELNLTATLDAKAAYSDADFVVIAAPTNVGRIYRRKVESSSKVDKRHQKCEKSYVAVEC